MFPSARSAAAPGRGIRGWKILPAVLLVLAGRVSGAPPVLTETFDGPAPLSAWENAAGGVIHDGALRVEQEVLGDQLVSLPLPVEELRGCRVEISARIKRENVVKAAEPWHGAKLMLQTESPAGPTYQNVPDLAGTAGWQSIGLSAVVPAEATSAQLRLGLGQASGVVWFDDIEVRVTARPRVRPSPQPVLRAPEHLDRRTDAPRLRGVMYGPEGREEDLRALAEWKANLIRWQFYYHGATDPDKRTDLAAYEAWLEKTMAGLDRLLPLCRELGLSVVIDLHTPPGGSEGGQMALFADAACQQKFIEVWDRLVQRYKDEPAVWGYDLLNEPVEGRRGKGLLDWRSLAEFVARRVRAADPHKAIFVEPGSGGGWDNLPFFPPLDVPGIIYSVHMYEPLRFTHQGVLTGYPAGVTYPGEIDGKIWNKEALRAILQPVREYQKDYNVPIYIGEFSAPRWAPGESAAAWLRDCLAIFEEYGWDWSYHAFREWHAWNVELGPDPADRTPGPRPTERALALREGFSRNVDEK